MPKLRVLIVGKVHEVGYRPLLLGLAESLDMERFFADNVYVNGKQAVEILIDADEDRTELFLDMLRRKKPENAVVEEIKVEDYDGRVMGIESYYRYLTAMQLAKIATYGGRMLEKQDETLGKMDKMLEKQDKMLEKQDLMLEKMDIMLKKQDETIREIRTVKEEVRATKEEVKATREELSSKLDKTNELLERRFERLEEEIERIKKALIKAGIDV